MLFSRSKEGDTKLLLPQRDPKRMPTFPQIYLSREYHLSHLHTQKEISIIPITSFTRAPFFSFFVGYNSIWFLLFFFVILSHHLQLQAPMTFTWGPHITIHEQI